MSFLQEWKRRRAARRNPCPICGKFYPLGVDYCEECRSEIPNRYSPFYQCENRINGAFIGFLAGTALMVYLARYIIFRQPLPVYYYIPVVAGVIIGWWWGPAIAKGLGRAFDLMERY